VVAVVAHSVRTEPRDTVGVGGEDFAARLAEVSAEYRKLSAAMSMLGSQLTALQTLVDSGARTQPPGLSASESAPAVQVNLLGPFQLRIGERDYCAALPGQVQTILKYLVSHRRCPVSRDALLDLLWGEADPGVASGRLRVLMHTLRRNVPCVELGFRDLVVMSGNNFQVNPDARLWVDAEAFERHWHSGWRLVQAGFREEAAHEYEQAESLYTGDYLEDDPYSDWTLLRREALRDAYAGILTMLATMSLGARDYTGTIIWAQKLLAQDNCHEDAYYLLMSSHVALGQTARAASWYSLCARTLKRELGVEPSERLRALHRQIMGDYGIVTIRNSVHQP
jgi:DNA-binding SARP family transcriptional activator